jgi:hypothetical protein
VAALFDQAGQIGLIELIDTQIPKRDQGLERQLEFTPDDN